MGLSPPLSSYETNWFGGFDACPLIGSNVHFAKSLNLTENEVIAETATTEKKIWLSGTASQPTPDSIWYWYENIQENIYEEILWYNWKDNEPNVTEHSSLCLASYGINMKYAGQWFNRKCEKLLRVYSLRRLFFAYADLKT